jgi:hypothetical protein
MAGHACRAHDTFVSFLRGLPLRALPPPGPAWRIGAPLAHRRPGYHNDGPWQLGGAPVLAAAGAARAASLLATGQRSGAWVACLAASAKKCDDRVM